MKNIEQKIYTIATAHLDTVWLWTLEKTISDYIPQTMRENFRLFEKYPEYVFNFEGSLRYELMEEYYPDEFEKVKEYVGKGRWTPCGSCYENGDVNVPSPEALLRNILYGNGWFEKKLGVASNDIFLPDCFGFGKALPSVAFHAGLQGFSTQKLSWGCSVSLPFDVGRWVGADGKGIWAAIQPGDYTNLMHRIRSQKEITKRISENLRKYGFDRTFIYHGTGDRGGAPGEASVKTVCEELRENNKNDVKVYSSSPKAFFDELDAMPEEAKKRMPVYNGEFLMTEHGAGSYTSRAVSKRWNRRGELLADAAERSCATAYALGLTGYPSAVMEQGWKKIIAHHFHDDITGTAFRTVYKRSWNDYVQAMNLFSGEYTAAVGEIAARMDTSFVQGTAVIVSNPVQSAAWRYGAVRVTVPTPDGCRYARVFDGDGNELPAQVEGRQAQSITVCFLAGVPSCGYAVFDVRPSNVPCSVVTGIRASAHSLHNKYYRIRLDENGDICSIFDRRLGRELLSAPIRMAVFDDVHSFMWPAWEVKYKDISAPPRAYAEKPVIRILAYGPAECGLEIERTVGKSVFRQQLRLDAESEYLTVYNETDWRSEASLCKAVFPTSARCDTAQYDIGLGAIRRVTNTEKCYEVPAQKWADITDRSGSFGVTVFSDSRVAWDKPDDGTLRLTCMHTPKYPYRWECSQHLMELGLNRYSFAVCGHTGEPDNVQSLADMFCQPMHAFVTEKHEGVLGTSYSFVTVNVDSVRITALKKEENGDRLILRVTETAGYDQRNVEINFALPIEEIEEVWGNEKKKNDFSLTDGKIICNIGRNTMRSFAVRLQKTELPAFTKTPLSLPYTICTVTDNRNRHMTDLPGGISIPKEILPDSIVSAGCAFSVPNTGKNAVLCDGQNILLPQNTRNVQLLMTALQGDRTAVFLCNDTPVQVTVPDCFEAVGAWDMVSLEETGYIKEQNVAWVFSHTHNNDGDMIAKQFTLFRITVPVNGAKTLTLPTDRSLAVFAGVAETEGFACTPADEHFDRLEKRPFDYKISEEAKRYASPTSVEHILDRFIDRERVYYFNKAHQSTARHPADIYSAVRMGTMKRKKKDR